MTQVSRRVRDPDAVRTTVLDSALELFARYGFADTSLREISRHSGVSHPLILHHFGSKEELYSSVKRRVVEGYAQRFPAAARAINRPINLRAEMKRILTYVGENELAMKLCARTRVDGDHQVWPGEPDLLNLIRQRIEVAQQKKLIRDDLDAQQLSVMILGIVFFWLDNRLHFAERFGKPVDNDSYIDTAVKMIEEGLLVRTPKRTGKHKSSPDLDP
ncbi:MULTISPECIES: TetR/AcrR family transcriptional regulator [unclassified Schlesneria]|uniref:TetR/AcrR family transcriptional regulator n=1 Tax=unclassified Schlesneria TaxID=2762017 RepID=UPI002F1C9EBE